MKIIFFSCYLLACVTHFACAQQNKTFKINPGDKLTWVIPFNDIYQYPAFMQGAVFFNNKPGGGGLLNYSHLSQEMFFIDNNGDTLALAQPQEIDSVLIGNDVFYNSKEGFIKIDTLAGDIKLGVANYFYITNKQVTGLYGQPTDASGNDRFNRFVNGTAASKMVAQDIFTMAKRESLFIGKKFNKLVPVNKKNMSNLFGKQQNAFNLYIATNDVNFSKIEDVRKLIHWMSTQQ